MKYSTEKTISVDVRGETFKVKLRMISLREKTDFVDDDGAFSVHKLFEESVVSVEGPEVNGQAVATGADILDTPGIDEVYLESMRAINNWDFNEEESKN